MSFAVPPSAHRRVDTKTPAASDETLVDLRCSVVIFQNNKLLLVHRVEADEWVLPGGRPRPGESMLSCARREVSEETGLQIMPGRCAFFLEVAAPDRHTHIVELVFLAAPIAGDEQVHGGEPGRTPTWVDLSALASLTMRPPIGGHVKSLSRNSSGTFAYLGNVWRPTATVSGEHGESAVGGTL